jgi:hypothetical protein
LQNLLPNFVEFLYIKLFFVVIVVVRFLYSVSFEFCTCNLFDEIDSYLPLSFNWVFKIILRMDEPSDSSDSNKPDPSSEGFNTDTVLGLIVWSIPILLLYF